MSGRYEVTVLKNGKRHRMLVMASWTDAITCAHCGEHRPAASPHQRFCWEHLQPTFVAAYVWGAQ